MNKANEKEKAMYKAMFSPDSKSTGDKKSTVTTGVCISFTRNTLVGNTMEPKLFFYDQLVYKIPLGRNGR